MNTAQHILVFCIRAYRLIISPAQAYVFGANAGCRFSPSCSQYALEAVRKHGALAGALLAVGRVGRCHPWGGCGEDPVPEKLERAGTLTLRAALRWLFVQFNSFLSRLTHRNAFDHGS